MLSLFHSFHLVCFLYPFCAKWFLNSSPNQKFQPDSATWSNNRKLIDECKIIYRMFNLISLPFKFKSKWLIRSDDSVLWRVLQLSKAVLPRQDIINIFRFYLYRMCVTVRLLVPRPHCPHRLLENARGQTTFHRVLGVLPVWHPPHLTWTPQIWEQ